MKSLLKMITLATAFLFVVACGNQKSLSQQASLGDKPQTSIFVGIPSHSPPQTIALGGQVEEIYLGHQNEFHREIIVESTIGEPWLTDRHQDGQVEVHHGYVYLQGWWTSP